MPSTDVALPCHICALPALEEVRGYGSFRRVTSDCKPWPAGGRLCVCRNCGCIQKAIDAEWRDEVGRIYGAYAIYHQSGGVEQAIFEAGSGQSLRRSNRLVDRLRSTIPLSGRGRLLDVGCGNGALLAAFSAQLPGWSLVGTELNEKYRPIVEAIKGVEALYTCAPEEIPGEFDFVVLMHALEHIPEPAGLLAKLAAKLTTDGQLLVEVPDHLQNPFDLLIADHCTHFTRTTLVELVQRAGFNLAFAANDWMPKELTVLARQGAGPGIGYSQADSVRGAKSAVQSLAWLGAVVAAARTVAAAKSFGLFGTSISATWLDSELENAATFFVDEDPSRVGKSHLGRPILHPRDVVAGSNIFVALPVPFADAVQERLAKGSRGSIYHVPPPFPS
jgi:SAM-dependent methyltransferase